MEPHVGRTYRTSSSASEAAAAAPVHRRRRQPSRRITLPSAPTMILTLKLSVTTLQLQLSVTTLQQHRRRRQQLLPLLHLYLLVRRVLLAPSLRLCGAAHSTRTIAAAGALASGASGAAALSSAAVAPVAA